jgi:hypothetical protein
VRVAGTTAAAAAKATTTTTTAAADAAAAARSLDGATPLLLPRRHMHVSSNRRPVRHRDRDRAGVTM